MVALWFLPERQEGYVSSACWLSRYALTTGQIPLEHGKG